MVAVGAAHERGIHEECRGTAAMIRSTARIVDAAAVELFLHHAAARDGVVNGSRQGSTPTFPISTMARTSVSSRRSGVTETNPSFTALKSLRSSSSQVGSSPPIQ